MRDSVEENGRRSPNQSAPAFFTAVMAASDVPAKYRGKGLNTYTHNTLVFSYFIIIFFMNRIHNNAWLECNVEFKWAKDFLKARYKTAIFCIVI